MIREFLVLMGLLAAVWLVPKFLPGRTLQSESEWQDSNPVAHVASSPDNAASPTKTADSDEPRRAAQLVRQAADAMHHSVPLQAKLRYRIALFGESISGPGAYFQAGAGSRRTRIEFEFGFDETAVQLHQFCDGNMLYTLTQVGGETNLEFVDLRQVATAETLDGNAMQMAQWLNAGSLSGLLAQLSEHFQFETAQPGQLDSIPVTRVTGSWKPRALKRLLSGQVDPINSNDGSIDWSVVPLQIPHRVQLTLGNDSRFPGFPYRIVFEQFSVEEAEATEVAVLELFELRHAPELTDAMFHLPDVETIPVDATDFYRTRVEQFSR